MSGRDLHVAASADPFASAAAASAARDSADGSVGAPPAYTSGDGAMFLPRGDGVPGEMKHVAVLGVPAEGKQIVFPANGGVFGSAGERTTRGLAKADNVAGQLNRIMTGAYGVLTAVGKGHVKKDEYRVDQSYISKKHDFFNISHSLKNIVSAFDIGGSAVHKAIDTVLAQIFSPKVRVVLNAIIGAVRFLIQLVLTAVTTTLFFIAQGLAYAGLGLAALGKLCAKGISAAHTHTRAHFQAHEYLNGRIGVTGTEGRDAAAARRGLQDARRHAQIMGALGEGAAVSGEQRAAIDELVGAQKRFLKASENLVERLSYAAVVYPGGADECKPVGITLSQAESDYIMDMIVAEGGHEALTSTRYDAERTAFAEQLRYAQRQGLTREEALQILQDAGEDGLLPSAMAEAQPVAATMEMGAMTGAPDAAASAYAAPSAALAEMTRGDSGSEAGDVAAATAAAPRRVKVAESRFGVAAKRMGDQKKEAARAERELARAQRRSARTKHAEARGATPSETRGLLGDSGDEGSGDEATFGPFHRAPVGDGSGSGLGLPSRRLHMDDDL